MAPVWAVRVRPAAVDGADHPPGVGLDQLDLRAAGRPDVGEVGGPAAVGPEPALRPPPQQPRLDQVVEQPAGGRAEQRQVGRGERQLLGGRAQVRRQDVGVVRVEHRAFDRPAEQCLRVVHEIGVERVVAGDEHAERAPAGPPGAADLLPERRPGAGEAGDQHRVEPAHVDAELERVGRRHAQQPPAAQVVLERAPLLGEVAAAVGVDARRQQRVDLGEQLGRALRHLLDTAPRPHEGERPDVRRHQVGEQVGGLGRRRAADRRALLAGVRRQRRLPQPDRDLAAG